ncbi:MAG: MFS transporter [Ilumatobacteraceae bacterium]|jgi:DHA3 family multidrug efflux protein-like MFS transporter|nr:MFS transporter [Ilumatobacteraceae bacterium]
MTPRTEPTSVEPRSDASREEAFPRAFKQLMVNSLVAGVTSTFLWFALTFWVYLETRSVVTTGVIAGTFSLVAAMVGPLIGTFVDHHRKHTSLLLTSAIAVTGFGIATAIYYGHGTDGLLQLDNPWFWMLLASTLSGSVAGNARAVVLATCVTILVPERSRARANGVVGTVTGLSFAITSVFSGLVIGSIGMGWAYVIALVLTVGVLAHVATIRFDEPEPTPRGTGESTSVFDVRGAVEAIRAVPGLGLLVFLAAFNNLLGGVFMALMDAYGLELVSVQVWGVLWGILSTAFIIGGLVVARYGLGSNPVRLIVVLNLVNWIACSVFTIQASIVLLAIGCFVWLLSMPIIEAAEQTVLQQAIPLERQGRVFGFAQLVENAAAPTTTFLVAPLAEAVFIPWMTEGAGVDLIGDWFGVGPDRGIAVMFTLAGLIGIAVTVVVWRSRSYRRLMPAAAIR